MSSFCIKLHQVTNSEATWQPPFNHLLKYSHFSSFLWLPFHNIINWGIPPIWITFPQSHTIYYSPPQTDTIQCHCCRCKRIPRRTSSLLSSHINRYGNIIISFYKYPPQLPDRCSPQYSTWPKYKNGATMRLCGLPKETKRERKRLPRRLQCMCICTQIL